MPLGSWPWLLPLFVSASCGAPRDVAAAHYYVDASCAVQGDGLGEACAASQGQPGAWRDAQTAFESARAGDTVFFKNGTYVATGNGSDPSENGGFSIRGSGTASAPITFKAFPGHSPLLANCPVSQTTYCPRPTITAPGREFVVVEGLRIHGGVWIYGKSETTGEGSRGMVFRGNEIDTGWGEVDDGNWAAFFIEGQAGARFERNYVHDIVVPRGGGSQDSGSAFKLYYNADVVIANNTVKHVRIPTSQVGGVDEKARGLRLTVRGNWIEDVQTAMRFNSQGGHPMSAAVVEGNVFIGASGTERPCLRVTMNVESSRFSNNTCVGFSQAVLTEEGPAKVAFFNNVVVARGGQGRNVEAYTPVFEAPTDYNVWVAGAQWAYPGAGASSLGEWKASGFDAHSIAASCGFDAAFRVTSGPCQAAGRVGGLSTGAVIQAGAYGVVSCVGNTCEESPARVEPTPKP